MSTAAEATFAIPELLGMILECLVDQAAPIPGRRVFPLRRVSSVFRDVIAGSAHLRQAMWLSSTPGFVDHSRFSGRSCDRFWTMYKAMDIFDGNPYLYSKAVTAMRSKLEVKIELDVQVNYPDDHVDEYRDKHIKALDDGPGKRYRPSWHYMKLLDGERPAELQINHRKKRFGPDEGTFGDVVDLLLSVTARAIHVRRKAFAKV